MATTTGTQVMRYLAAAVILVGLLGLLNLVLMIAVVGRLRELNERVSRLPEPDTTGIIPAGQSPGPFEAVTTDGGQISHERLSDPTLVAFFSPGCSECVHQVPEFTRRVAEWYDGREHVIAVVVADPGQDTAEMVARLEPVAQVVVERPQAVMTTAFQVNVLPVICLLDASGTVRSTGDNLDRLLTGIEA
jgi:hypothetical protein